MKEFIDKLISRLEELYDRNDKMKKESYKEKDLETFELFTYRNEGVYTAISIVNQLAEEYKDKYVSKDEVGYMLDTIEMRGDETWMDYYHKALKGLCELSGEEYNNGWIPASVQYEPTEHGKYIVYVRHEENHDISDIFTIAWYGAWNLNSSWDVIAWMPIPDYQPKGE